MAPLQSKNQQIIDAAVEVFQEQGFAGASMDRIAARAGVSKRTVYNHFENKDALFRAILDLMAAEANAAVTMRYDKAQLLRPQLVALGAAEGRLLLSSSFMRLARMALGETIRDPALAAELNARMEHVTVFEVFFKDAAAAGSLRCDEPERAAAEFIGMIKAQGFWPAVFTGDVVPAAEMDRIIESSVDTILGAYGA